MKDISRTVFTPWIARTPTDLVLTVAVSIARPTTLKSGQRINCSQEFSGQHQPRPQENLAS